MQFFFRCSLILVGTILCIGTVSAMPVQYQLSGGALQIPLTGLTAGAWVTVQTTVLSIDPGELGETPPENSVSYNFSSGGRLAVGQLSTGLVTGFSSQILGPGTGSLSISLPNADGDEEAFAIVDVQAPPPRIDPETKSQLTKVGQVVGLAATVLMACVALPAVAGALAAATGLSVAGATYAGTALGLAMAAGGAALSYVGADPADSNFTSLYTPSAFRPTLLGTVPGANSRIANTYNDLYANAVALSSTAYSCYVDANRASGAAEAGEPDYEQMQALALSRCLSDLAQPIAAMPVLLAKFQSALDLPALSPTNVFEYETIYGVSPDRYYPNIDELIDQLGYVDIGEHYTVFWTGAEQDPNEVAMLSDNKFSDPKFAKNFSDLATQLSNSVGEPSQALITITLLVVLAFSSHRRWRFQSGLRRFNHECRR